MTTTHFNLSLRHTIFQIKIMVNLKYDDYFTPLVDGTRLCKILIGSGDNKTVCGHPIKKQKKSSESFYIFDY